MKKKQLTFRQRIINDMPLILLQILIRNKALDKYVRNVINDPSNIFEEDMEDFCTYILRGTRAISSAFTWEYTPEGHYFWKSINQQYC